MSGSLQRFYGQLERADTGPQACRPAVSDTAVLCPDMDRTDTGSWSMPLLTVCVQMKWQQEAVDVCVTFGQMEKEKPRTGASSGLWWPQCPSPHISAILSPLQSALPPSLVLTGLSVPSSLSLYYCHYIASCLCSVMSPSVPATPQRFSPTLTFRPRAEEAGASPPLASVSVSAARHPSS